MQPCAASLHIFASSFKWSTSLFLLLQPKSFSTNQDLPKAEHWHHKLGSSCCHACSTEEVGSTQYPRTNLCCMVWNMIKFKDLRFSVICNKIFWHCHLMYMFLITCIFQTQYYIFIFSHFPEFMFCESMCSLQLSCMQTFLSSCDPTPFAPFMIFKSCM